MKRICVIDGQGGGIGAAIIKTLKNNYGETIEILALGTNAVAASLMLKAGANQGASGDLHSSQVPVSMWLACQQRRAEGSHHLRESCNYLRVKVRGRSFFWTRKSGNQ